MRKISVVINGPVVVARTTMRPNELENLVMPKCNLEEVVFECLTPKREALAKEIIIDGLENHWGEYDPSYNPDVTHLCDYYGSNMKLALYQGRVIGCFGWKSVNPATVELVRVSVERLFQKQGVGALLVQHAEAQFKLLGYKDVVLETTTHWRAVVRFYLNAGYKITHSADGDTYFCKRLLV